MLTILFLSCLILSICLIIGLYIIKRQNNSINYYKSQAYLTRRRAGQLNGECNELNNMVIDMYTVLVAEGVIK
jgi:hypothetical protein